MIKKVNIALAILFALLFGLKGLKELKVARERDAAAPPPVSADQVRSELAPTVYYVHWTYFSAEDPISNRNGVLLDMLRAIFPNARFVELPGKVESFAEKLRTDPHAVVAGFGAHPTLAGFRSAPTPMAYGKLILMTLRSNPWSFAGAESLDQLRIVTTKSFLDYGILRERYERLGGDSPQFRVLSADTSLMEMAAMVEAGEADAFAVSGDIGDKGVAIDTMSIRILQRFRKSKPIDRDNVLLYVSTLDEPFAQAIVEAYETGLRNIDATGERHRIFDYYEMVTTPLPPAPAP